MIRRERRENIDNIARVILLSRRFTEVAIKCGKLATWDKSARFGAVSTGLSIDCNLRWWAKRTNAHVSQSGQKEYNEKNRGAKSASIRW